MGKMVQVRNVPEDLHRELKARAALQGVSLSDYLLQILKRAAERATPEEMALRLAARTPVNPTESSAAIIRRMRDALEDD